MLSWLRTYQIKFQNFNSFWIFITSLILLVLIPNWFAIGYKNHLMGHDNFYWFTPLYTYFFDGLSEGFFPVYDFFDAAGTPLGPAYVQTQMFQFINFIVAFVTSIFSIENYVSSNILRLVKIGICLIGIFALLCKSASNSKHRIIAATVCFGTSLLMNMYTQPGIIDMIFLCPWLIYALFYFDNKSSANYAIIMTIILSQSLISYFSYAPVSIFAIYFVANFIECKNGFIVRFKRAFYSLFGSNLNAIIIVVFSIASLLTQYVIVSDKAYMSPLRLLPMGWEEMNAVGSTLFLPFSQLDVNTENAFLGTKSIELTGSFIPPVNLFKAFFLKPIAYNELELFVGPFLGFLFIYGLFTDRTSRSLEKKFWSLMLAYSTLTIVGAHSYFYTSFALINPFASILRHSELFQGMFMMSFGYFAMLGFFSLFNEKIKREKKLPLNQISKINFISNILILLTLLAITTAATDLNQVGLPDRIIFKLLSAIFFGGIIAAVILLGSEHSNIRPWLLCLAMAGQFTLLAITGEIIYENPINETRVDAILNTTLIVLIYFNYRTFKRANYQNLIAVALFLTVCLLSLVYRQHLSALIAFLFVNVAVMLELRDTQYFTIEIALIKRLWRKFAGLQTIIQSKNLSSFFVVGIIFTSINFFCEGFVQTFRDKWEASSCFESYYETQMGEAKAKFPEVNLWLERFGQPDSCQELAQHLRYQGAVTKSSFPFRYHCRAQNKVCDYPLVIYRQYFDKVRQQEINSGGNEEDLLRWAGEKPMFWEKKDIGAGNYINEQLRVKFNYDSLTIVNLGENTKILGSSLNYDDGMFASADGNRVGINQTKEGFSLQIPNMTKQVTINLTPPAPLLWHLIFVTVIPVLLLTYLLLTRVIFFQFMSKSRTNVV